ncbi:MAG: ABC transporter substrate-binding protein, partial [Oscillibacter sp.]|nr:ABC transporter substrate-binding protein [Oscillibacter sp.]
QGKETPSVEVTDQIFDTLTVFNPTTNEIEPQIAESWEQTNDTTYVFKIRQGIKFHDGTDLKASDVKFSLERAINSSSVSYIVDFIDKVETNDDYTVTITTKAPYAPTLRNLSIPFAAIVPQAAVEADEDAFIKHPIGSGPYKFVEWKQGDHVTMKAFDDYYAGKPATKNLVMKVIPEASQRSIALETGEIDLAYDLLVNDISKVKDNQDLTVFEVPSLSCWYISLNMNKEPFNNAKVREALSYAIDRQTLIDTINAGSGQPADDIIAPGVFGYFSTGVPEYNPEKAKQLLADAGYPNGFSTSLWVNDNQSRIEMCQAIQAMLQDIGVTCKVEVMEFGSFISKTSNGEHDMAYFGWTTSSADADYTFYSLEHSSQQGAAGNRSFLADPEIDSLIEKARSSSDEQTRKDLYKQVAEKLAQIDNNLPIFYSSINVGASKKVEGFVMDPNGYHKLERVKVAA